MNYTNFRCKQKKTLKQREKDSEKERRRYREKVIKKEKASGPLGNGNDNQTFKQFICVFSIQTDLKGRFINIRTLENMIQTTHQMSLPQTNQKT